LEILICNIRQICAALVFFACTLIPTLTAWAISITIFGSWTETIDVNDLIAGAGSDLQSTYASASDAITVDIGDVSPPSRWRVDIKKVDGNWHGSFAIDARRTSDGSGSGKINAGTAYQEITDIDNVFFDGSKTRSGIGIQLRLRGVSITVPPATYTTTIYYTAVDI